MRMFRPLHCAAVAHPTRMVSRCQVRISGLSGMYAFCAAVLLSLIIGVLIDTLDDEQEDLRTPRPVRTRRNRLHHTRKGYTPSYAQPHSRCDRCGNGYQLHVNRYAMAAGEPRAAARWWRRATPYESHLAH